MKAPHYRGDGRAEFSAVESEVLGLAVRLDKDPALDHAGAPVRLRVAAAMRRELAAIRAEMAPRPNTGTTTTRNTTPGNTTRVPDPYVRR